MSLSTFGVGELRLNPTTLAPAGQTGFLCQPVPEGTWAAAAAVAAGGAQVPLGTYAKSASASGGQHLAEASLVRRYALQSAARELLPGEKRLQGCVRWLHSSTVQLLHVPRHQVGAFGGLQHCGSVWQCPVCSAKISERRRQDLAEGVERWQQRGGVVLLVTYTVRHHRADDLKSTLKGLLAARRRLLSCRWADGFTTRYGIVGRIRALEVTHGENGWHPHVHELVFLEGDVDRDAFLSELREQWSAQVLKVGLKGVNSHGVDVRFADLSVGDYVAKFGRERTWGPEHELTKSAAKVGKQGNRGPIGLLADYLAGDDRAGALWREYAQVFKGSRQLTWSRGLRGLLGFDQEQTDEEIAAELREDAELLEELSREEWQAVLGNDARAELLQVLGSGSVIRVREFLGSLGVLRRSEVLHEVFAVSEVPGAVTYIDCPLGQRVGWRDPSSSLWSVCFGSDGQFSQDCFSRKSVCKVSSRLENVPVACLEAQEGLSAFVLDLKAGLMEEAGRTTF